MNTFLMPVAGLEPARIAPRDFESRASANSATPASVFHNGKQTLIKLGLMTML